MTEGGQKQVLGSLVAQERFSKPSDAPGRLAALAHELLTVVLPHGDQKLVQAHRCIDGDLAAEE